MTPLLLFVVIAAWLTWAIPRDLERAVQRRRAARFAAMVQGMKSVTTAFQQMEAPMKKTTAAFQRLGERMRDGNL